MSITEDASGDHFVTSSEPVPDGEVGYHSYLFYVRSGNAPPYPYFANSNVGSIEVRAAASLSVPLPSVPEGTKDIEYPSILLVAEGGGGTIQWSVDDDELPDGLDFYPESWLIAGTPTQAGTFTVTVTATDDDGASASQTLTMIIESNLPPLGLLNVAHPDEQAMEGAVYRSPVFAATGASATLDPLSDNLSWSYTPAIAGVDIVHVTAMVNNPPHAAGGSAFAQLIGAPDPGTASPTPRILTVSVSDSMTGETVSGDFELLILENIPALTLTAPGYTAPTGVSYLPRAMMGQPYEATFTITGGQGPFTWRLLPAWGASTPPSWLVLSEDGILSGTPGLEDIGTAQIRINVFGSGSPINNAVSRSYTFTVDPIPLNIVTASLPNGYPRDAYAAPLDVTGGSGQYTWALNNSELPDGLELNHAGDGSWSIDGTPEESTASLTAYAISFTVSDAVIPNLSISVTLSLRIIPDLTILTTNIPAGVAGGNYDATLHSFGGIAPYSYTATNLPAGLSVFADAGGVWHIGGVLPPDIAGLYDVTLTATDSDSPAQTDIMRLMLVVNEPETPAISVITTYLPPVTGGESYGPLRLEAVGGVAPYTWTAAGLPDGLTLYSNGVLTGTVEADAGEYTITVQVRDSSATPLVATANYLLIVTAGSTDTFSADDPAPGSSAGLSNALVGAAAAGCTMGCAFVSMAGIWIITALMVVTCVKNWIFARAR
ncbi:MAG: putative Ig domain-containing protein [Planctomycetaceae bacterium]|nr:putative Ig domain-containing protein [Planctomycetaceae bacterium]